MLLQFLEKAARAINGSTTPTPPPVTPDVVISLAPESDRVHAGYKRAVTQLLELPHFTFKVRDIKTQKEVLVLDKIVEIIKERPTLINNPIIQEKLHEVIEHYQHWKDHASLYKFLSKIEPLVTPELLNRFSSDTLRFVGELRTLYVDSAKETLKQLKKCFPDDLRVEYGYNGALPPGLKHRLKAIRQLTRHVKGSEFGKYETDLIKDLEATKVKWNRAVMPKLRNIQKFRNEFKKSTGRLYNQKEKLKNSPLASLS